MKGRRIRLVENAVERTARMLAHSYGIRVVWKGAEASTDGKTINLPVLPDDAPDELLEAVQGYLDHETAHIIFTDFKAVQALSPQPTEEQFQCINVVEDVRVEQCIGQLFPGSPYNLHRSHDWVYEQITTHWDSINQFRRALAGYFDYTKYGETEFWNTVVDQQTKDIVLDCVDAVGSYSYINSTKDAIAAGYRLFEVLKEHAEEEEKQRKEEEKKKKSGGGGGSKGQEQKKPAAITSIGQLGEAISVSSKDVIAQAIKSGKLGQGGYTHKQENDGAYLIYSTAGDTVATMPDGNLQTNGQNLQRLRDEARSLTSVLKTRFVNSLRTQTRRRWVGGKDEGKLDSRRLHRSLLGFGDDVYKQLTEKQALDTAVVLAIDHSGSMSGHKLELAGKAAIVLGDALAPLKIPFAVYGYSTEGAIETPANTDIYARWGRLWIRYYRDFNEPWEHGAIRLAGAAHNVKNNTLDAESVKHGIKRLLLRKEKRKILLVLNDGMPYPGYGHVGRCQQHLHDVVASAAAVGVEVVAFGIQDDDVKEYYPKHVVIRKLDDLVAEPLQVLDKMLRHGRT